MWKVVLSITLVMGAIMVSLHLLKNVPSYIQESEWNLYSTVEQAEYALRLKILLPSYFPEYFIWPPSEIKVVRSPSLTVSLVFLSRSHSSPSLVIHQIISNNKDKKHVALNLMEPKRLSQESQVLVGGAKGTLIVGVGEDGKRWTQLSWKAVDRKMVLIANCSVEDLLKIARSIH
jgi:hypothetical protein